MNKRLLNKLRMCKAVLAFLKANRTVWETIPDVVSDVDELQAIIDEIEATQKEISVELTGQSDEKDTAQEKLIQLILSISSALMARADRTGNEVLAAKVHFSESDVRGQRDQQQVITGLNIADLAEENLEGLISSGITIEHVTALREQTAHVEALLPVNRVSVAERKAANAHLKLLVKQANKLLKNRLDRMMVRYETEDEAFYAAYENARLIVDYGIRHEHEGMPD